MVLEDHRLPQVTFQIFIPGAGGYYDPLDNPGLASFTVYVSDNSGAFTLWQGPTTNTSATYAGEHAGPVPDGAPISSHQTIAERDYHA